MRLRQRHANYACNHRILSVALSHSPHQTSIKTANNV